MKKSGMIFDSRCHCLGGLPYARGITVLPALRSPQRGQLKLFKIDPVNFVVFSAGDCMDAGIRATQDAKAGMRIKYGIE